MAITLVGAVYGATTSATLPAHTTDDLIIGFAFRDGSTTAPSVPAGWTQMSGGTGANTCSHVVAYFRATGSGTSSGTWTNATGCAFLIFRSNISLVYPGNQAVGSGSSTTINYPAVTAINTYNSLYYAFAGHRSTNTSLQTAPAGMINRATGVDATDEIAAHSQATSAIGNWSSTNVSVGGTSSGYRSFVGEVFEIAKSTVGSSTNVGTASGTGVSLFKGVASSTGTSTALAEPPPSPVLESFEELPRTQFPFMMKCMTADYYATTSIVSNITEGTQAVRFTSTVAQSGFPTLLITDYWPNSVPYVEAKIDLSITSVPSGSSISFQAQGANIDFSLGDTEIVDSGANTTGSVTLTLDLSLLSISDYMRFIVQMKDPVIGQPFTFTADNFRLKDSGGTWYVVDGFELTNELQKLDPDYGLGDLNFDLQNTVIFDIYNDDATLQRSTSNVTEGLYSWNYEATTPASTLAFDSTVYSFESVDSNGEFTGWYSGIETGAPPILIESFEGAVVSNVPTGFVPWLSGATLLGTPLQGTVTRVTSSVTEGTYACEIAGTASVSGGTFGGIATANWAGSGAPGGATGWVDMTGYNSFNFDLDVVSGTLQFLPFCINHLGDVVASTISGFSTSGSYSIALNTGYDLTQVAIVFAVQVEGAFDIILDNVTLSNSSGGSFTTIGTVVPSTSNATVGTYSAFMSGTIADPVYELGQLAQIPLGTTTAISSYDMTGNDTMGIDFYIETLAPGQGLLINVLSDGDGSPYATQSFSSIDAGVAKTAYFDISGIGDKTAMCFSIYVYGATGYYEVYIDNAKGYTGVLPRSHQFKADIIAEDFTTHDFLGLDVYVDDCPTSGKFYMRLEDLTLSRIYGEDYCVGPGAHSLRIDMASFPPGNDARLTLSTSDGQGWVYESGHYNIFMDNLLKTDDPGGAPTYIFQSSGSGVASGVGKSIFSGITSSTNTGTATGVGKSIFSGVAASVGDGQASAVGLLLKKGVFASTSISTEAFVGRSIFSGVAASTNVSVPAATGASIFRADGSSTNVSTSTADGRAYFKGVGSTTGAGVADAGSSYKFGAPGSAAGTSTAQAASSFLITISATAASSGTSVVAADGYFTIIKWADGTASGTSNAVAFTSSPIGAGSASGTSVATGRMAVRIGDETYTPMPDTDNWWQGPDNGETIATLIETETDFISIPLEAEIDGNPVGMYYAKVAGILPQALSVVNHDDGTATIEGDLTDLDLYVPGYTRPPGFTFDNTDTAGGNYATYGSGLYGGKLCTFVIRAFNASEIDSNAEAIGADRVFSINIENNYSSDARNFLLEYYAGQRLTYVTNAGVKHENLTPEEYVQLLDIDGYLQL